MGIAFVLAWQNVIFLIPLCIGILLVFAALAADFGDADADADAGAHLGAGAEAHTLPEADADAHALDAVEHESGFFEKGLSLLGVGKVPLTLLLMMGNLIFGVIGMGMNALLAPIVGLPMAYGIISVVVASVSALVLTRLAAELIGKLLPSKELVRITRHSLAGKSGVLLLPSSTTGGLAQITDQQGGVHNIHCQTYEGTLPKGTAILVVEYDEEKDVYFVTSAPDPEQLLA